MTTPNNVTDTVRRIQLQCLVFAEAIRQGSDVSPIEGIPEGVLYGLLAIPAGVSLEDFEAVLATLVRAGLVERKNRLCTWIGPKFDQKQA